MVDKGKVLTGDSFGFYTIDLETKETKCIFEFVTNDYLGSAISHCSLDGKFYFGALSKSILNDDEHSTKAFFLLSLDIVTGEYKKVVEDKISIFWVTDNKIYYVPYKYRILYMPDNGDPYKTKAGMNSENLYSCALDGSEITKIYTNDNLFYSGDYTVINNILYGWFLEFDSEKNDYNSGSYGALDLSNGKLKYAEKID